MNVVDSSGWIEFFTDSPDAARFEEPISDPDRLVVPSVTLLEVFKFVLRHRGETAGLEAVAAMQQGQVVDLDAELAILAGKMSREHSLPLADSIIYATAQTVGATVWTQDSDFEGLGNVNYFAKSD